MYRYFTRLRTFSVLCLFSACIYLSFATLVETRATLVFAESTSETSEKLSASYLGAAALLAVLAMLALTGCKEAESKGKSGSGVSESECRILINAAKDNPTIDVPEACKQYQQEDGKRLELQSATSAYSLLHETALDLRHFGVQALKLKPTVKTGNELRPNGMTVSAAALITQMHASFVEEHLKQVAKDMDDLNFYLAEAASKENLVPGDLILPDIAYMAFSNSVNLLHDEVVRMHDSMVFELRETGSGAETPMILSVTPDKTTLSSGGGKVNLEVLIDDPESLIDSQSVKVNLGLGKRTVKELKLTEKDSDPEIPGIRKFKGSWSAPKNQSPKAVTYIAKASGTRSDNSNPISSGDRNSKITVKGKLKK